MSNVSFAFPTSSEPAVVGQVRRVCGYLQVYDGFKWVGFWDIIKPRGSAAGMRWYQDGSRNPIARKMYGDDHLTWFRWMRDDRRVVWC